MSTDVLRVHKLIEGTKAEGPGFRLAVWVQGCSIHCDGCFEKDTWDPHGGYDVSIQHLINVMRNENLEGITVLGGEPFDQPKVLSEFLKEVRAMDKNSIVFSGYSYDHLMAKDSEDVLYALSFVDLLVDGEYRNDLPESERPMIGSSNQRFIALSDAGKELIQQMGLYRNKVEVRISKTGTIMINGMWKERDCCK